MKLKAAAVEQNPHLQRCRALYNSSEVIRKVDLNTKIHYMRHVGVRFNARWWLSLTVCIISCTILVLTCCCSSVGRALPCKEGFGSSSLLNSSNYLITILRRISWQSRSMRGPSHININTNRPVDHGKTTPNSSNHKDSSQQLDSGGQAFDQDRQGTRERQRNHGFLSTRRVWTPNRHYAHVDCPGHADYVKEHDYRSSSDGRSYSSSSSNKSGPCLRQRRAHPNCSDR